MSRARLSLRSVRGLLVAPPAVWFLIGTVFAGQLPGEPLHHRVWLVVLLFLAFLAGVLHEGMRPNGTLALLDRLAALDVEGYAPDESGVVVAVGALPRNRRPS